MNNPQNGAENLQLTDLQSISISESDVSSGFTAVSQEEISKLVSIQVRQELLSKYLYLYENEDDYAASHTALGNFKNATGAKFYEKFHKYPPVSTIILFQNWYAGWAAKYKIIEIFGAAGYFSLLYPFVILGLVLGNVAHDKTIAVFVCNILAIIPLSVIISYLTESLAHLTNPTIGGLINITFGNAIELIFSILALFKGQLDTVQGSMVGSWLATLLLILGCAFFFASFNKKQLHFSKLTSHFNALFVVFSGFITKMVYSLNYNSNFTSAYTGSSSSAPSSLILKISRGLAGLHLVLYAVYLLIPYQYRKMLAKQSAADLETQPSTVRFSSANRLETESMFSGTTAPVSTTVTTAPKSNTGLSNPDGIAEIVVEAEPAPKPTRYKDIAIYMFALLCVAVIAAFNSDYLLDSLEAFSEDTHIPKTFITVILIPIFSNAAEHVTSIVVAYKGQMELAMNIAVGSAIQINFFIVPFLILIAAASKSPYSFLYENTYTEALLFASVIGAFAIWNGKAYFVTGVILLFAYVSLAMVVFFMH